MNIFNNLDILNYKLLTSLYFHILHNSSKNQMNRKNSLKRSYNESDPRYNNQKELIRIIKISQFSKFLAKA